MYVNIRCGEIREFNTTFTMLYIGPSRRVGKEQEVESSDKGQEKYSGKYSQYKASIVSTLVHLLSIMYNTSVIPP